MSLLRPMMSELTKALAVLALVFLSFAHQPVAVAQPNGDVLSATTALSYCGESPDEAADHAPCHACRAGVADLPAPPCIAAPAFAPAIALAAALPVSAPVVAAPARIHTPRAPPVAV